MATATLEHPVAITPTEFLPVRLWNTQFPGQTIVDRRGFTQKDDPALSVDYQFAYGVLTVYSQADKDFILEGRPYIVEEDIPQSSPPLVCDECQLQTRSSRFYQVHKNKHI